jgi:predicted hotdog family 3-hydroxylacyl-ACP dehydratase
MSDIAALVPHTGAMVLLDEVVAHDERHIRCRTRSHRDPANPLARGGMLPVFAGIEYAAQAMAAHFGLASGSTGKATLGLLGALRDVACSVSRLDDVTEPLIVACERLSHDRAGSIYAFSIGTGAGSPLLRGRATVVHRERETP